ncbi:MAG TPA: adenylate/guanylate cyclase domain-containing protein [Allocoleopsis sp.]
MLKRLVRIPQKMQLRLLLVLPFVLQIFLAVGVISYLSVRNGQQAVNAVASELSREISDRIQLRLQTDLEIPQQVNQINADAIDLGLEKLTDLPTLDRFLWRQIKKFDTLTSIHISTPNQGYMGIFRREDGSITIDMTHKTTERQQNWATDSQGNRTQILETSSKNNVWEQPKYQAAIKAGNPTWTEVSRSSKGASLKVWATQPIYDTQGKLLAVTSSSLSLSQISEFLRGLKIGHTGQTFILERNGLLVATSTPEEPVRWDKNTEKLARLKAIDSSNALTRATAKQLAASFGNLTQIKSSQQLEFQLKGQRQFIQVMPLWDDRTTGRSNLHQGLDWLVVVVVPEADFMGQIHGNTRTIILLCVLALMLALLLGLMTSRWITQPIIRLSEASMAIARGKLDQTVEVEGIKELRVLATFFNQMVAQLRESYRVLKQTNQELERRVEQRTAALRLSEEKFALAFRCAPHPMTITTLTDECYIEVNDSFLRLCGYELQEIIGHTANEVEIWANPEDHARIIQMINVKGALRNQEVNFRTKSDEVRTLLLSAEKIDLAGEVCLLCIGNDITERKRIEQALREQKEYLRLILDNIPLQVFWKDANLVFLGCNQNWATAAGISTPESVVGKTDYDVLPNREIADLFRVQDSRIMETVTPELHIVASKPRPSTDGQPIWLDISKIPLQDSTGKVIGILGVVEDITLRKNAEEALRVEQEKSERLLLNILPQAIAEQLKQNLWNFREDAFPKRNGNTLIAEQFDEVTIMFADIVGFTPLSARVSPHELVSLLNEIFSTFDQLAQKHGLEKIKTIGDAYMVAGGLPMPKEDHAEAISPSDIASRTAKMALDMQKAITQFEVDKGEPFQIRIGINTGPVVAGVIGIKKFIYDLWGDTVNVASRMESQGIPGRIQVTASTYERLQDKYVLKKRGTIPVKGKGDMTTYWLIDAR